MIRFLKKFIVALSIVLTCTLAGCGGGLCLKEVKTDVKIGVEKGKVDSVTPEFVMRFFRCTDPPKTTEKTPDAGANAGSERQTSEYPQDAQRQ